MGCGEPGISERPHLLPGEDALLAAASECPPPATDDLIPEDHKCAPVRRHGVVIEVSTDNLLQPSPLCGDRLMHAPSQRLLDLLELRPQAVASRLPFDQELASPRLAADE